MSERKGNGIASAADWRAAAEADRRARAERLTLPSGATILAARPEPMEWVMAGRLPQRLLTAAVEESSGSTAREMTSEEILELARFAARLVEASVIEPAIGDGPGEIPIAELPADDCAFIFEWACRALGEPEGSTTRSRRGAKAEVSSEKLERFRSR